MSPENINMRIPAYIFNIENNYSRMKKKGKPFCLNEGDALVRHTHNLFYDGFNSKIIETARFEGDLEIPVLEAPSRIEIPTEAVPFSHRRKNAHGRAMLVFYEKDPVFRDFVSSPQKYLKEVEGFLAVTTPDCSVYRDMPLSFQIANIAVSRSVGFYLQQMGMLVYPNVRWGDERTYTKKIFECPPAFAGIPRKSIVSVGSYGCIRSREDKWYFRAGLEAMLSELEPRHVLVYGNYNKKIFGGYERQTEFHFLQDWISRKRGGYGDR